MGDQLMDFNIYGYVPTLAAGIAYIVVFSLLTIASAALVVRSRIWWLSVVFVGGLGEVIGWAGRTWASKQYRSLNAFLIQQICLILAPCFYSAALYGTLGMVIRYVGQEHSLIRPSWYLIIFCLADLIAIVIQAVGGGMAAVALQNDESSTTGTHIMLSGIVIQLAAMIAFCFLAIDFYRRQRKDRPAASGDRRERLGLMFGGMAFVAFWILVRCIYRVVELAEGWTGYLITHEIYFLILDSMAMSWAHLGLVVAWPSFCLPDAHRLVSNKAADGGDRSTSIMADDGVTGPHEQIMSKPPSMTNEKA